MNASTAAYQYLEPLVNGAMVLQLEDPMRGSGFSIVRNYSTTFLLRACLYAATCIIVLGVGIACAQLGAWPVLLCCAAEMAAMLYVWLEIERHKDDREIVTIEDESVVIAISRRELQWRCSLQRYWARLICSPDGERIALRSHGNEVEIGVGLVKRDKLLLARYLAAQLRQRPL
jgi:uncharacterized membrane protein